MRCGWGKAFLQDAAGAMRLGCVEQSSIERGYAQLGALDTNLSTWKVPETEMLLLYTVFDAMCSTLIIVV